MHVLHDTYGVSPWLDNLSRDLIVSGTLASYVSKGVRGVTSNPSIFEKAFKEATHYYEPFTALKTKGVSTIDAYWQLAIEDIQNACDVLRSVYDESGGNDGFVSLEVSPEFARDSEKTIAQARELWSKINRPNTMIKIPATEECLPAISAAIADGINVNVTLIFSLHRYLQVVTAYMDGLEKCATPQSVRSVASFFVSRVDSEVDTRLEPMKELQGKAAVAQARAAYGIYLQAFNDESARWSKLKATGAVPQRALWASTSTKNPSYPDLLYVEGLLAPHSVNTLPDATIDAIIDHANFSPEQIVTPELIEQAHETLAELTAHGVDMNDVARKLETEGVEKFQKAFSDMLAALDA